MFWQFIIIIFLIFNISKYIINILLFFLNLLLLYFNFEYEEIYYKCIIIF